MTLIYFILVLGITIFIHELGHFLFAKKAGIYIYEFSLGMGPRIFKFNRKNDETNYSIRLFPIGGFVSMAGEDIEVDKNIPSEKQMFNKTWIQKCLVIIAGVMFNFILAIVLLFIVGLSNGVVNSKPIVNDVISGYSVEDNGMVAGDTITKINNKNISNTDELILEMQVNLGKDIKITVKHKDSTTEVIKATPQKIETDGEFSYKYGFSIDDTVKTGVIESIKYAFYKTGSLINQMISIVKYLVTGKLSLNNLSGPVGIYNIVGESSKAGFINIVYLIAYLCINVGFINLIPLPAFDGGRLLFLIIEKIKGSKVNSKVENTIHTIGFGLLMILMIFVTYNDILRIFK